MAIIVGITGGIATGKTTVLKMFKKFGIKTIDVDKVYHGLIKPTKKCWKLIVNNFGKHILNKDNSINREKLRNIIFQDEKKRKKLERITHPLIINELKKRIKKCKKGIIAIEIPLLVEKKAFENLDYIVLVYSNKKKQIERIKEKNSSLSNSFIKKMIESQIPISKKKKYAHFVIDNNSTLENTFNQVKEVIKCIKHDGFKRNY